MPQRQYTVDLNYNTGNTGQVINSIGQGLENITRVSGAAAIAVGAVGAAAATTFGVQGINNLREYGRNLDIIQGIFGATPEQFQRVEQAQASLAANTEFTIGTIQRSYENAARAGVSLADSNELIARALRLSTASATDADVVTRNLTATLRTFGLDITENAGRVSDVFTVAINNAALNLTDLTERMDRVGPIARALGIEFEEVVGAVQAAANVGVTGERAFTGLAIIMRELERDGRNLSRGLVPVLRELAAEQLSFTEQVELFGSEAAALGIALTDYVDDIERFTEQNRNAAGSTEELARAIEDNLDGSFRLLTSSYEALQINFFQRFEEDIRVVVDGANQIVLALAETPELLDQIFASLATFVGATGGLALLSSFGSVLTNSIVAPLTNLVTLNFSGLLANFASLGGTIAGIAGVGGAFGFALAQFRETFIESDSESVRTLGITLDAIVDSISELTGLSIPRLSDFTNDIDNTLDRLADFASEAILNSIGFIDTAATNLALFVDRTELLLRNTGLEAVVDGAVIGIAFAADNIINGVEAIAGVLNGASEIIENLSLPNAANRLYDGVLALADFFIGLPAAITSRLVSGASAEEAVASAVSGVTISPGGGAPPGTIPPPPPLTTQQPSRGFLFNASDATEEFIGNAIQTFNQVSGLEAASLYLTQRFPRTTDVISSFTQAEIPVISPFLREQAENIPFGFLLPTGSTADIVGGLTGAGITNRAIQTGRIPTRVTEADIVAARARIDAPPDSVSERLNVGPIGINPGTAGQAFDTLDPAAFTSFRGFDQFPNTPLGVRNFLGSSIAFPFQNIVRGFNQLRRFGGDVIQRLAPNRSFQTGFLDPEGELVGQSLVNRLFNRVVGQRNLEFRNPTAPRIRQRGDEFFFGDVGGLNQQDINEIFFLDQPAGTIPDAISAATDPNILARAREIIGERNPSQQALINNLILGRTRSAAAGNADLGGTFTADFSQSLLDIVLEDSFFARNEQAILAQVARAQSVDPNVRRVFGDIVQNIQPGQIQPGVLPNLDLNLGSVGDDFTTALDNLEARSPELIGQVVLNTIQNAISRGTVGGAVGSIGGVPGAALGAIASAASSIATDVGARAFRRGRQRDIATFRAGGGTEGARNFLFGQTGGTVEQIRQFGEALEGINLGSDFDEFLSFARSPDIQGRRTGLGGIQENLQQGLAPGQVTPELVDLPTQLTNNVEVAAVIQDLLDQGTSATDINRSLRSIADLNARALNRLRRQGREPIIEDIPSSRPPDEEILRQGPFQTRERITQPTEDVIRETVAGARRAGEELSQAAREGFVEGIGQDTLDEIRQDFSSLSNRFDNATREFTDPADPADRGIDYLLGPVSGRIRAGSRAVRAFFGSRGDRSNALTAALGGGTLGGFALLGSGEARAQEEDSQVLAEAVINGEVTPSEAQEADPTGFARTFPLTAAALSSTRGSIFTGRTTEELRQSIQRRRERLESGGLEAELRADIARREARQNLIRTSRIGTAPDIAFGGQGGFDQDLFAFDDRDPFLVPEISIADRLQRSIRAIERDISQSFASQTSSLLNLNRGPGFGTRIPPRSPEQLLGGDFALQQGAFSLENPFAAANLTSR